MVEDTLQIDCFVSGVSAWEHDHGAADFLVGGFDDDFGGDSLRVVYVVLHSAMDEVHFLHQFTSGFVVKGLVTVVVRG